MKKAIALIFPSFLSLFILSGIIGEERELHGTLVGQVFKETGESLSGVRIYVKGGSLQTEATSSGNGSFKIKNLPTGVYQVSLEAKISGEEVIKDVGIYLGKETYITLVERLGFSDGSSGEVVPNIIRDSKGRVIYQEIIIEDEFYSTIRLFTQQ